MVKFLIVRFSSIGDIVLTTPVIRCLKNQVENAEIHFLTKKQFEPVLINNPYIDKLWLLEKDLDVVLSEIREVMPDYIIDLHHNLRSGIVKRKLKLASFSFDKINFPKWLIVNLKYDRLPQKHIVDRYMETTRVFDIENDGKGLDYFTSGKDEIMPEDLSALMPSEYIALVIGAQHFTKKMPTELLARLCDMIELPVLILGGPGDLHEAEEIISHSSKNDLLNTCGKLSLNQSAVLVRKSRGVISHDTGLMHIAAAYHKRIFSIWGNTIPEFGMYPYQAGEGSEIFEVKNLKCRPCSKIGFQQCPKKHFRCMTEQDLNAIAKAVNG